MPRLKNGPDCVESESALRQRRKASLLPSRTAASAMVGGDEYNLLTDALFLPQNLHFSGSADSPVDNVRRLLETVAGTGGSSVTLGTARTDLFCEMLYLNTELAEHQAEMLSTESATLQPSLFWQQTSRWIKFEQCVEGAGTRLSRPHVTLLNLVTLVQLKNCLRRGTVLLDCAASSFIRLCDCLVEEWSSGGQLDEGMQNLVREVLFAPKLHLIGGKLGKANDRSSHLRRASYTDSFHSATGAHREISSSFGSNSSPDDNAPGLRDADQKLMKKLAPNTEAAAILIANVSALDRPLSAFVRLTYPTLLYPEVPDHPIPVRFLFVLLNSLDNFPGETVGIGRAMGALFSDEVFQKVAFHCQERHTLGDAIDEFLSQAIVIPPGKCSAEARWTPEGGEAGETAVRHVGILYANYSADELAASSASQPLLRDEYGSGKRITPAKTQLGPAEVGQPLRTGRPFGGLVQDIRRKLAWFPSDFADFFRGRLTQSLACTLILFFANLSNIITFGAVMERSLHHHIASIENIICGALSGIIFGLFSGQPLNILSATGPTLIFEKILFDFCTTNHWEFLPFRFYVGAWVTFYLFLLVATDASALVALITRFTEEAFATLISVVFIIQAFEKLLEISYEPISPHPQPQQEVFHSACHCLIQTEEWNSTAFKNVSIGPTRCLQLGGEPQGLQCYFKSDVYMFSVLLTFATFLIASSLYRFRASRFFSFRFRNLISDFGVLIAIVSLTLLTYMIGLEVPSLKVPARVRVLSSPPSPFFISPSLPLPLPLEPTLNRHWLVDFTNIDSYKVALVAALPALFYTILLFMDQQITAVIINRKDNKLRKGGGYHLDLLLVALLVLICSFFGLPFYVAATVLSVMHVESLKQHIDSAVPGERQRFLGVKEQRLTAVVSHLMIGSSVLLTPLLKLVPLPVLTGIFLYMGIISLLGQQFVQRVGLLFMPVKYQPDYIWLRAVPIKRVHVFTSIQLLSIASLLAMKYSSSTLSMCFPVMLVFTVLIRMFLLEKLFSQCELRALDDQLPGFWAVVRPPPTGETKTATGNASGGQQQQKRGAGGGVDEEQPLQQQQEEQEQQK